MFKKIGKAVIMQAMFFLSFYFFEATGWAQYVLEKPPEGIFRIGGTVTTSGGFQLTNGNNDQPNDNQFSDEGYTFAVTRKDGTFFISGDGKTKSEDTDGLNEHDYYVIDIPLYDAVTQPKGKKPEETAFLHVYKNGLELSMLSTPNTYEFTTVEGGTAEENPIKVGPKLYVSPPLYVITKERDKIEINVTKAGSDEVNCTPETDASWIHFSEIGEFGNDDKATITINCDVSTGEKRIGKIEVSGNLASDTRSYVTVEPRTVEIIQTGDTAGDVNQDGILDMKDVALVHQILTGTGSGSLKGDVNGDGRIGTEEAIYVLEYLSGNRK
jgi:hypothetical protein